MRARLAARVHTEEWVKSGWKMLRDFQHPQMLPARKTI
jgi:hypothetical protein